MSVQMMNFKKKTGTGVLYKSCMFPVQFQVWKKQNYFTNRPYGSDISEIKLIQMFAVDYDYLTLYSS